MLTKLLKYEYRATAIYFLPIYAAILVVSVMTYGLRILRESLHDYSSALIAQGLFTFSSIYALLAFGLAVTTFVVIIIRFYKNLLGNEGYLMFTLPVSVEQNILAKLIPAMTWFLGSCVLGVLTILPVFFGGYGESLRFFFGTSHLPISETPKFITFLILLAVGVVSGLALTFLFYYFCMIVGQTFNSHKFLAAAGTFLLLQLIFQVLGITAFFWLIHLLEIIDYGALGKFLGLVPITDSNLDWFFLIFLGIADVVSVLVTVGLFFLDSAILRKKLNLT